MLFCLIISLNNTLRLKHAILILSSNLHPFRTDFRLISPPLGICAILTGYTIKGLKQINHPGEKKRRNRALLCVKNGHNNAKLRGLQNTVSS